MDRIIPTKKEAQKWANALRSGKYKQTKETLQDEHGYCCLGVACKLFIATIDLKKEANGFIAGSCPTDQPNGPLWLDEINSHLKKIHGTWGFMGLNDEMSYTFDEIADIIELVYVHKAI